MIEVILLTIFISTFINIFLKRFNIPTIIGYIFTGIGVSYLFNFNSISNNNDLKLIAEFGIVFLMFTIGLEFSVKHFIKMKKYVFLYGLLQFVFTSIIFFIFSYFLFNLDIKTSIIVSSGLTLSSTAIVLKILNDNKEINKRYGQKVLGILLFQDLAVIPILLLISVFSQNNVAVSYILIKTLISSIILLFILWFFGKYILDVFLEKVYKTNSNEIFIGSVFLLVLGSSFFAHYLGLSYSIGAFIAGIMIAETHFKYQIESALIPFRDLLLGVFFITVGMQLDFKIIIENYQTIFLLLVFLVILKVLILFLTLIFSTQKSTSLKTALSLFQVGEFALVIFELSSKQGLINSTLMQLLVVITIISMIMTPFILKYMDDIVYFFIRSKFSEFTNIKDLSNHIVLIGYGRVGKMLSQFLDNNKQEHVIIESELGAFSSAKKDGKRVVLGTALDDNIIEITSLPKASNVVLTLGFGFDAYPLVKKILEYIEKDKLIVKISTYGEKEKLMKLGISNIIVETEKTAMTILDYLK